MIMRSRDKRTGLPEPECRHGYTRAQVEQIMGDRINDFYRWMYGQTVARCEGRSCQGVHGIVTYRSDVMQYLDGGAPLD